MSATEFRPLSLKIEPVSEAFSTVLDRTVLKTHLAIDEGDTVYDDLLDIYEAVAIQWAEDLMYRTIIARTHRWTLNGFPGYTNTEPYGAIRLPRGKTIRLNHIQYSDSGVLNYLYGPSSGSPGENVQEDFTRDSGGIIMPLRGESWPSTDTDVPAPVVVSFEAGYALAADVPQRIKYALMFAISDMMEIRGTTDLISLSALASGGKTADFREGLLSDWRLLRVI